MSGQSTTGRQELRTGKYATDVTTWFDWYSAT